MISVMFEIQRE